MDKIINKHIDEVEKLEEEMNVNVVKAVSSIDIDEVVADPEATISKVVSLLREVYIDEYSPRAVELGFEFGRMINRKIEEDRPLKVDDSKDANLNDTDNN